MTEKAPEKKELFLVPLMESLTKDELVQIITEIQYGNIITKNIDKVFKRDRKKDIQQNNETLDIRMLRNILMTLLKRKLKYESLNDLELKLVEAAFKAMPAKEQKQYANSSLLKKAECIGLYFDHTVGNALNNNKIKDKIIDEISDKVDKMDKATKEALFRSLNIDAHSKKALVQFLKAGGIPVLLNLGGFSTYLVANSIMHIVGTVLLGTALPFAAYVGLSKFIAILAGPIGWLLFGGISIRNVLSHNQQIFNSICLQIVGTLRLKTPLRTFNYSYEEAYGKWFAGKGSKESLLSIIDILKTKSATTLSTEEAKLQIEFLTNLLNESKIKLDILQKEKLASQEQLAFMKDEIKKYEDSIASLLQKIDEQKDVIDSLIPDVYLDKDDTYRKIVQVIDEAEIEVDILSPWISPDLFNTELYIAIKSAIERGVTVKILFGMNNIYNAQYINDRDNKRDYITYVMAERLIETFKEYNNFFINRTANHDKVILIDDNYIVNGSLNVLSKINTSSFTDRMEVRKHKELIAQERKRYFKDVINKDIEILKQ